jgi:arsenite-transporting ATPase
MTEFVLYGGKGGVGKTTVSSATALHMAQAGGRVLLVSTDPAHSVGDVFATELGPEPTRVRDDCELFALEVDPEHRFDEKYADAFDSLVSRAESLGVDVSGVDVDSRGVIGGEEVVVVDLLSRYVDSEWDYVVLDTAPTGHTLRLLKLPEVLDSTLGTVGRVVSRVDSVTSRVSGLLGDRDGDGDGEGEGDGENGEAEEPIDYEGVEQRLREVESVLTDPQRTRFRAVMEPEKLSLAETERLVAQLEDYDIPLDSVVINKVLTDIDEGCSLCSARRDRQRQVIEDAERSLSYPLVEVPLLEAVEIDRVADRLAAAPAS